MNTIDKRVVGMEFDNRQFESGVKTSLTSIENLKKSLDFGSLADGIQQISDKFSVLGIAGITAIQNIANRAVDAGMRIASSLTIAPVMEGFNEYETKMGSIQTILTNTASKGTTLEDVTNTLNELNTYADKTIYNFSEMARNIGTFTAAGVGLGIR